MSLSGQFHRSTMWPMFYRLLPLPAVLTYVSFHVSSSPLTSFICPKSNNNNQYSDFQVGGREVIERGLGDKSYHKVTKRYFVNRAPGPQLCQVGLWLPNTDSTSSWWKSFSGVQGQDKAQKLKLFCVRKHVVWSFVLCNAFGAFLTLPCVLVTGNFQWTVP